MPLILSTLRTVLSQGVEIQLKILQTLVSLLTNCKDIHGETLAETLLISFKLQESKIGVVSSTAAATLRQLVMFVFEGVDEEDRTLGQQNAQDQARSEGGGGVPDDSHPSAKDAYLVFEDICLLVNGEAPSFLKLQSLPRTFGLELIESVLSDFSSVFLRHSSLLHLLRSLLSPLLIRALAERPSFSTTLRLMRVMYLLLKKFNDELGTESEIFLTMFIKIVAPGDVEGSGGHPLSSSNITSSGGNSSKDALRSSLGPGGISSAVAAAGASGTGTGGGAGNSPPWMRVLALEILRGLCGDFDLLRKIWDRYDASSSSGTEEGYSTEPLSRASDETNQQRVPVFTSMITSFNRLATEKPALLGTGTAVVSGVPTDPVAAGGEYLGSGVVDGLVGMAQQAANSVGVHGPNAGGLATQNASVKLQWSVRV